MTPSSENTSALLDRWSAEGVGLGEPVAPEDLLACERRLGTRLPTEMSSFYFEANGMPENEMDPRTHVRIWPLAELEKVEGENGRQFARFADFLLWSHSYVIALSGDPAVYVAESQRRLADSFEGFLVLLRENSDALR